MEDLTELQLDREFERLCDLRDVTQTSLEAIMTEKGRRKDAKTAWLLAELAKKRS